MKIFGLLKKAGKKDNVNNEVVAYNRVQATVLELCDKYIVDGETLEVEVSPKDLDSFLKYTQSKDFTSKYEYQQLDDNIFALRLKDLLD